MSEDKSKHAPPAAAAPGGKKSGMMGKIIALSVVGVVVATECLLASMYLADAEAAHAPPSTEKLAKAEAEHDEHAHAEGEGHSDEHGEHGGHGEHGEAGGHGEGERAEVDMQSFYFSATNPTNNLTLNVEFHLYGTVDGKDKEEFAKLLEENLHRHRDQVMGIVRKAELTDLADPELGLIKRRILTTTNRSFGRNLLKEVMFSQFSFYEQ